MAKIHQIPIPNTSIFEPVSSVYENNLTYVEFLLGILKKINETVEQVNKNSEFIEEYNGRIEVIEAEMAQIRIDVNDAIARQDAHIDERLDAITQSLTSMIDATLQSARDYSDSLYEILDNKINMVAVGQINVLDPTTGLMSPLQEVINNLAGNTSDNLTATEYDALSLTATAYDGYNVSAFDYDFHAKSILV